MHVYPLRIDGFSALMGLVQGASSKKRWWGRRSNIEYRGYCCWMRLPSA